MPFKQITNEFRKAVQERETSVPETKRRKFGRQPKNDENKASIDKTYVAEAYNIASMFFYIVVMVLTPTIFTS
jgi:syntaxin 18